MDREQFARDNFNLIYSFMDAYHIRFREDEIMDVLFIGYTYALNGYDKNKGTFATLAYTCMKREYFKYLRSNKYPKRNTTGLKLIPLDKLVDADEDTYFGDLIPDPQVNVEKEVIDNIYWADSFENVKEVARRTFTDKQWEVFKYLYVDKLDMVETGKKLDISTQAVSNINRTIYRRLIYWFRMYKNMDRTISRRKENYGAKDIRLQARRQGQRAFKISR